MWFYKIWKYSKEAQITILSDGKMGHQHQSQTVACLFVHLQFYESQLSAAVVPSFFETYCNGAVESLVCGTPTLLSDRAGASEVYEKYGLSKLLFSIDDMLSFESALAYAEKNNFCIKPDLTKQIYDDLRWDKVIAKYNAVFDQVRSR